MFRHIIDNVELEDCQFDVNLHKTEPRQSISLTRLRNHKRGRYSSASPESVGPIGASTHLAQVGFGQELRLIVSQKWKQLIATSLPFFFGFLVKFLASLLFAIGFAA